MTEAAIKAAGKRQLEAWGWMVINLIQTNQNGITDTLNLRNGRAVFIEWKRPGQNPRQLQDYRIKKLQEQGFEAFVARSINDIKHLQ